MWGGSRGVGSQARRSSGATGARRPASVASRAGAARGAGVPSAMEGNRITIFHVGDTRARKLQPGPEGPGRCRLSGWVPRSRANGGERPHRRPRRARATRSARLRPGPPDRKGLHRGHSPDAKPPPRERPAVFGGRVTICRLRLCRPSPAEAGRVPAAFPKPFAPARCNRVYAPPRACSERE